MLVLQLGGDLVERVLGLFAQHGLARAETNLCLRGGLVLIDVPDHGLNCGEAGVNGGRRLLGHLSLVGRLQRMLISFIDLGGRKTNAFLGARIAVLDHLAIGSSQLIEFGDTIADGLKIPLYIVLAGKWVQDEPCQAGLIAVPEVLWGPSPQRFSAGGHHGL